MGIVHGEAAYLPDFLDYFSTKFPSAPVKMEILGKKDIETTTMVNFYAQVSRKIINQKCNREISFWRALKFASSLFDYLKRFLLLHSLTGYYCR